MEGTFFHSFFSNNPCLAEWADIFPNHSCKIYSSLLALVSERFYSFHTHRRIDKRQLAFPLLFDARSLGR
ncbi:hypothetical protein AWW67_12935 [Roseivirga seohaensis]|uniref:Uncharacterized protein n=1 Tax=Roseivirga seohaensis TaxID=1914963 RepID=A0A150XKL1_9BACT|nr:hypothetical protein AWW67_12935 [Roseivirga seohaensis]